MHQHRSSGLKQSNKAFKSGKHSTKGAIKRKTRGKVDNKAAAGKKSVSDHKDKRKNRAKQLREAHREKIQDQYRSLSHGDAPPRGVALVPLGKMETSSAELHQRMFNEATGQEINTITPYSRTFVVPKWKQRITTLPCSRQLDDILLSVQVANVVLYLVPESGIDEIGFETLRVIRSQGSAAQMAAVEVPSNKSLAFRKDVEKKLCYEFAEKSFKVVDLAKTDEVLRGICQIGLQEEPMSHALPRPFLLVEMQPKFFQVGEQTGAEVSGYLRGGSLNANQLVHIPNFGDFQLEAILSETDPHPIKSQHDKMTSEDSRTPLSVANPERRESLESENEPDPLEGEQTMWEGGNDLGERSSLRKVPKGTSAYQATWILEEDDEEEPEDEANDEMRDADAGVNTKMEVLEEEEDEEDEEYDYVDISDTASTVGGDSAAKRKLEQEDMDYPDEMETPKELPARVRFQKYRGLASFRTSPWDPKEELPRDYARIFQFRSLKRTQDRVMDEHDGVPSGAYITLQILDVPPAFIEAYNPEKPLVLVGLFPYERKMSVLNFSVRRIANYTEPIASKDDLIFYCGARKLNCKPVFTENIFNCDKHKYERFWLHTTSSVATIYGPTTFMPCPVLVFKRVNPGEELGEAVAIDGMVLVGTGSLISVDPDRLNIKKITLTGETFKILKRKAVIRRMFHNAEDILWFKPVELRTRLGHTGNILESIGTHGHMRCLFDSQLKQHDVIMMNLYKRVYPKWKPSYVLQDLHQQTQRPHDL